MRYRPRALLALAPHIGGESLGYEARDNDTADETPLRYEAPLRRGDRGIGLWRCRERVRLARAGLRVCVLERGREILTGEFPSRFPQMAKEMQLTGAKLRTGSDTGLYDVRLGEDMHVLVGCGVGGGSLVNAGVALRPDAARAGRSRLAR